MANIYTETLVADGDGTIYKAYSPQGTAEFESIGFTVDGTWQGATVTLSICMDTNASPQVFTQMTDNTGSAIAAFTDDASGILSVPDGALFKATVSGSGSPVPALNVTFRGDVAKA